MRTWDTKAIFRAVGGPAAMRDALAKSTGKAPELTAIYMWDHRNRISADWIVECIAVALTTVNYLSIWDLIREQDQPDPPSDPSPPQPSVFPPYTGELDY